MYEGDAGKLNETTSATAETQVTLVQVTGSYFSHLPMPSPMVLSFDERFFECDAPYSPNIARSNLYDATTTTMTLCSFPPTGSRDSSRKDLQLTGRIRRGGIGGFQHHGQERRKRRPDGRGLD